MKYYNILGLQPEASIEEVKEAYKDLVKVWHPDRFTHDPKLQAKTQEKLKEINEAYQKIQEGLNAFKSDSEQYSQAEENDQSGTEQSQEKKDAKESHPPPEPPKDTPPFTDQPTSQTPRPWVRYWARTIDLILLAYPAAFLFAYLFPEFTEHMSAKGKSGELVLGLCVLPFMVAIEAFILSIFGNTPAKAILKTKITNAEGKNLTFIEAIKRGFYIYFAGYGLGFPIAAFFTYLWQYNKLNKQGKAGWDKSLNFSVSHSHIGGVRVAAFVVLSSACLFLVAITDIVNLDNERINSNRNKIGDALSSLESVRPPVQLDFDDPWKKKPSTVKEPIPKGNYMELSVPDPWDSNSALSVRDPWDSEPAPIAEKRKPITSAAGLSVPPTAAAVTPKEESQIWLERGRQALKGNNYREAITALNASIQLSPSFDAYRDRGYAYVNMGNYVQAINDLSKAIQINPNDSYTYIIRGAAYGKMGNEQMTINDAKMAARLGDKDMQQLLRSSGINW